MLLSIPVSFTAHLNNLESLHVPQGRAEAHGPAEGEGKGRGERKHEEREMQRKRIDVAQ